MKPTAGLSSTMLSISVVVALAGTLAAQPEGQRQTTAGAGQQGTQTQGQTQGQGQQQQGGRRGGQATGAGGQQRDPNATPQAATTGTASLAGVVLTADTGKPVKRARVLISAQELRPSQSALTDDSGLYSFTSLPAGRYTITASKNGYLDAIFGQKEPRRPGTPVQLADGQKQDRIDIHLPRGGVITGVLLDENGDPSPGTQVRALRYDTHTGEKQLVNQGNDQTDDRGIYRIYNLPPADYVVTAMPQVDLSDLRQMVQDVAQAYSGGAGATGLNQLANALGGRGGGAAGQAGGRGGGRGGGQQLLNQLLNPTSGDDQPVGYAPVYFPGTTSASTAATVTVGVGQEKSGIDFQLKLVPTAKLTGTIAGMDTGVQGISLQLVNADSLSSGPFGASMTSPTRDGKFTFSGVAPGQYLIEARGMKRDTSADTSTSTSPTTTTAANRGGGFGGRGGRGGGGVVMDVMWGELQVNVDGHNQDDLVMTLQDGMTISGNIRLDQSAAGTPPDLTQMRVNLAQQGGAQGGGLGGFPGGPGGGGRGGGGATQVDASGRFTVTGVVPGKYTVRVTGAGAWTAKSVVTGGKDTLDFGLQIRGGDALNDLQVTVTNKSTKVSGTLTDASGGPTSDYTIIVFPADSDYWLPNARRIQATRPGTDGTYSVSGLPAGDYLIAAVTDLDAGQQYDPSLLDQLKRAGTQIHLADGDQKTQDLRLSGGG